MKQANAMMARLTDMAGKWPADSFGAYTLELADNFEYTRNPKPGTRNPAHGTMYPEL